MIRDCQSNQVMSDFISSGAFFHLGSMHIMNIDFVLGKVYISHQDATLLFFDVPQFIQNVKHVVLCQLWCLSLLHGPRCTQNFGASYSLLGLRHEHSLELVNYHASIALEWTLITRSCWWNNVAFYVLRLYGKYRLIDVLSKDAFEKTYSFSFVKRY